MDGTRAPVGLFTENRSGLATGQGAAGGDFRSRRKRKAAGDDQFVWVTFEVETPQQQTIDLTFNGAAGTHVLVASGCWERRGSASRCLPVSGERVSCAVLRELRPMGRGVGCWASYDRESDSISRWNFVSTRTWEFR